MLLTAGRASAATLAAARAAYGDADADANAALRRMQMTFLAAPEFHATGALAPPGPAASPSPPLAQAGTDTDFRAVVVLYLSGGADSYSLLVPHSNCTGPGVDLYAQYATVRSGVDLAREALLPVDNAGGTQPYRTFGLHPGLAQLAALYGAGEAALVANIGQLYEPLHARQVRDGEKRPPIGAFGHNSASFAARRVAGTGTMRGGVLGRLASELDLAGLRSGAFSLAGSAGVQMLEGGNAVDVIDPTRGTVPFAPPSEAVRAGIVARLANQTAALHADVYADAARRGIARTKELTAPSPPRPSRSRGATRRSTGRCGRPRACSPAAAPSASTAPPSMCSSAASTCTRTRGPSASPRSWTPSTPQLAHLWPR